MKKWSRWIKCKDTEWSTQMDELLRRIKDCKEQVIHINIRSDGIMAKVQNGFIKEKEEI